LGSGGAGGYFAPSMVIGGCLGAAVGVLLTPLLPAALVSDATGGVSPSLVAVFALVGMAAFWTSVAKVPVGSVIIVSELTGSYHLLLPAMWTCAIAFVLSRRYRLMSSQVPNQRESQAHLGDFSVDVLRGLRVSDILPDLRDFRSVRENTPLEEVLGMHQARQAYFPVVDEQGRFTGIFSLNDLRAVLGEADVWRLLLASDIAKRDVLTLKPSQTLAEVAARFAETEYDELPVVSEDDPGMLLGLISRRQLNNAYIRRIMRYEQAAQAEDARSGASERMKGTGG
jgi:chloride channel protein, CIC family